jgi:hypothetical protein
LLLMQWSFAPALHAQDEPDLRYLLFDPVPITIETHKEGDTETYIAHELLPPPQGATIDLRAWLASRYDATTRTQEELEGDIARYSNVIATLEAQQGPLAPALTQELLGLAAMQAANGAEDAALQLYERALHIIRVNNGLYAPEQQQIVSRIVATHLARGDLLAANEEQEYLFYLQRRNAQPSVDSLLEPLQHQADWNLFTFSAFTMPSPAYDNMPAQYLNQSFKPNSQELKLFRAQGLLRAQATYQQMIALVVENDGAADPKLPPLQLSLAATCFYFLSNFDIKQQSATKDAVDPSVLSPIPVSPRCARVGHQALEERLDILKQNQATPLQQLKASLDLVDWLLYSDRRLEAMELIETQRQDAVDAGVAADVLAAQFDPPVPVAVPAFAPAAYSRQQYGIPAYLNLEHKGYIDVQFTVTPSGASNSVKVLSYSPQTPEAVENRLNRHIRATQFRPRLTANGPRSPDLAYVRYYYTY